MTLIILSTRGRDEENGALLLRIKINKYKTAKAIGQKTWILEASSLYNTKPCILLVKFGRKKLNLA